MPYMIEGTWSGYRSSQERLTHRHYAHRHYVQRQSDADAIKAIGYSIRLTDGTELILRVSHVARRKEPEIRGYNSLIAECVRQGVNSVAELRDQKNGPDHAREV